PATNTPVTAASGSLSGSVPVAVAATDNVAISKIELFRDGVSVATSTTSPLNYTLNTIYLPDGPHTLSAKATDSAGNVAPTETLAVANIATQPQLPLIIDVIAQPPQAIIASLEDNQLIREGLVDLTGTADDGDPVDAVGYKISLLNPDGTLAQDMTPAPKDAN